jgi:hypothetical protein
MTAACNLFSFWFDADNEPVEQGTWFYTGLDKRFQEVGLDCVWISQRSETWRRCENSVRQILHRHNNNNNL